MNPKSPLQKLFYLIQIMAVFLSGCSQEEPVNRPNVLFIISDDLNDAIEGMNAYPQAKTPNIKKLAERGVMFTNAHSNAPLCSPSRTSLWTGLYPTTSGKYDFSYWRENPVVKESITVMEHFRNNGYKVFGTGKVFHNNQEDKEKCYDEYKHGTDFGPWPFNGKDVTHHPSMNYLFEKNEIFRGGRVQTFGPLSDVPSWPADEENDVPGFEGWFLDGKQFRYENDEDRDLMPDEKIANYAIEVLGREHEDPFMLTVGFNRLHAPLYAPKKYFDLFEGDSIEIPKYLINDLEDAPGETMKKFQPLGFYTNKVLMDAGGLDLVKERVRAYLACVAFIDDLTGQLLEALENSPYAHNTIVVFTSDHGFNLGEKDYIFKDAIWEGSTRIPMVFSLPDRLNQGQKCAHPVSLIDLYPTLIDLCGLPSFPNAQTNQYALDGFSLKPFLENPSFQDWKGPDVAFSLIGGYATKGLDPDEHHDIHYSVRGKQYRYSLYATGEEELYDHESDPYEWKNLVNEESMESEKELMKQQLSQFLQE